MVMKMIREGLGRMIVFIDFILRPKKIVRTQEAQREADQKSRGLTLYQFYACPFCVKVRRAIRRHNVTIPTRDAQNNVHFREELLKGGGAVKVPCLRIEEDQKVTWMYESNDIIKYLDACFGL